MIFNKRTFREGNYVKIFRKVCRNYLYINEVPNFFSLFTSGKRRAFEILPTQLIMLLIPSKITIDLIFLFIYYNRFNI